MKTKVSQIVCLIFILLQFSSLLAQSKIGQLKKNEKQELIKKISELIRGNYVFPDLGKKFSKEIKTIYNSGKFDKISESKEFGEKVKTA